MFVSLFVPSTFLLFLACLFVRALLASSLFPSFSFVLHSLLCLFLCFLSHRFTLVTPLFVPLFISSFLHLFVPPLIPSSLHSLNPPLTPSFINSHLFILPAFAHSSIPLPLDPSSTPSSSINSIIDTFAIPRPPRPLVPPVTPAAIPRSFRHIHSFPSSATVAGATTQEARKRDLIFEGVRRQRRQRSPACLCFPRVCSLFGSATGN